MLDDACGDAVRLVADPSASSPVLDVVGAAPDRRILLAVGPEGGWNTFELELLARHGFTGVSMGPRTLRVDTAWWHCSRSSTKRSGAP